MRQTGALAHQSSLAEPQEDLNQLDIFPCRNVLLSQPVNEIVEGNIRWESKVFRHLCTVSCYVPKTEDGNIGKVSPRADNSFAIWYPMTGRGFVIATPVLRRCTVPAVSEGMEVEPPFELEVLVVWERLVVQMTGTEFMFLKRPRRREMNWASAPDLD